MNEAERNAGLAPTPGYRYADVVGDELFLAGQVPHDADGTIVGIGDAHAQAERCLENLFRILRVHGFETTDIRRLVVYVVGEDLSAAWNAVRTRYDGEVPPATLLGVARLGHPGQLVEIDATVRRT
jgi:enamine deaminase RidA (YjgF/YER057c/UK114 family)